MPDFAHIAIDGPAGSGKTTVARALARRLGFLYLDTGAMYRAVALAALRYGVPVDDESAILRLAQAHPVNVVLDADAPEGARVYIGDEEAGLEIYRNEVSTVVSSVAAYSSIRSLMVERQRAIARTGPVIMAGRDIGTVVLPRAPVKVFLTASLDVRTDRRYQELLAAGRPVEREELRRQMLERDKLDQNRTVAPLVAAADAVEIDSSELSVETVVERISALVEDRTAR